MGGGSRCCFSSQASTFQVVNRELSRFPRTRAEHVWVRARAFLARNSAGVAIKTSMRSSKRGSSFSFFVLFFFPPPPQFVTHLDLLLKIPLDRKWSDVLSRWPLSVLSLI